MRERESFMKERDDEWEKIDFVDLTNADLFKNLG